jgi:hypothetical protein
MVLPIVRILIIPATVTVLVLVLIIQAIVNILVLTFLMVVWFPKGESKG